MTIETQLGSATPTTTAAQRAAEQAARIAPELESDHDLQRHTVQLVEAAITLASIDLAEPEDSAPRYGTETFARAHSWLDLSTAEAIGAVEAARTVMGSEEAMKAFIRLYPGKSNTVHGSYAAAAVLRLLTNDHRGAASTVLQRLDLNC